MIIPKNAMPIKKSKYTKSTWFILPFIGVTWEELNPWFYDCYIGIKQMPKYNDHVILLFEWSANSAYNLIERALKGTIGYITTIDLNKYSVFIFSFPKEYKEDLELLKQGKYSQVSEYARKIIGVKRTKSSKVYKALYPTEEDRKALQEFLRTLGVTTKLPNKAEILSIMNMEQEILDLDNLHDNS